MPPIDIVFEGGGAKGLAHNGAMAAVFKSGRTPRRLVGTSAGAITAALVAAGHDAKALRRISLETTASGASRMTEFLSHPGPFDNAQLDGSRLGAMLPSWDFPPLQSLGRRFERAALRALLEIPGFANLFSEVETGGLFGAQGFVAWLREQLEARAAGLAEATFKQLYERTGIHLTVVVTDTDDAQEVLLNHVTAPHCPVYMGVRMSMSIPLVWPEVVWQRAWGHVQGRDLTGHRFVDGGVVSNFALRALVSDETWVRDAMGVPASLDVDVLGFRLDDTQAVRNAPAARHLFHDHPAEASHRGVAERIERIANTVLSGNDDTVADRHRQRVCRLPAQGYGVTEFNMSQPRIEALLAAGEAAAQKWFTAQLVPA